MNSTPKKATTLAVPDCQTGEIPFRPFGEEEVECLTTEKATKSCEKEGLDIIQNTSYFLCAISNEGDETLDPNQLESSKSCLGLNATGNKMCTGDPYANREPLEEITIQVKLVSFGEGKKSSRLGLKLFSDVGEDLATGNIELLSDKAIRMQKGKLRHPDIRVKIEVPYKDLICNNYQDVEIPVNADTKQNGYLMKLRCFGGL